MKILRFCLLVTFLSFIAIEANAFQVSRGTIRKAEIFGIKFPNGESFYGNANKVVSISKQEYIAGPLLVTEVCIELDQSNLQVRIYNARTIPPSELSEISKKSLPEPLAKMAKSPYLAKRLDDSKKNEVSQQKVYKDYPTTTHARTLEFISPELDELNAFYNRIKSDFTLESKEPMNQKLYILEAK